MTRNRDAVIWLRLFLQHRIDRGAQASGRLIFRADLVIINKEGRSALHSKRTTALVIGIDPQFGLLSVDVLFELIYIEPDHSCIRIEQFTSVVGFAPNRLLSIKQIVHFPKTALQTGGFRNQRGFPRVLMVWEREIAKDNP